MRRIKISKQLTPDERGTTPESPDARNREIAGTYAQAEQMLERVRAADTAYPLARSILEDLNASPRSGRYADAKDRILEVLRTSNPSLAGLRESDVRGLRFMGGDKRALERRFGERVYPATLTIPDDVWYNYYVVNSKTGGVCGCDAGELMTELGYTSERQLDSAITGGLTFIRGEEDTTGITASKYHVRKGSGLVRKLREPDSVAGINFSVEGNDPKLYPFNKIGGLNIIAESFATPHEDYHIAWGLYHGGMDGVVDEIHARRVDVLAGRRTWDEVKRDIKDSDYLREGWPRGTSMIVRTGTVEHAIDTVAYLDRHLSEAAVSHILLNAESLRGFNTTPELLVMGEIKSHVLGVLSGQKQWGGLSSDLSKRFAGGKKARNEGPETERGVREIDERIRGKIRRAGDTIHELGRSHDEKEVAAIILKCRSLDEFLDMHA